MTEESEHWRNESLQYQAIIVWLSDLAGIESATCWPITPEVSHPEDNVRVAVTTEPGVDTTFRVVSVGFDSTVARLAEWIHDHRETEQP